MIARPVKPVTSPNRLKGMRIRQLFRPTLVKRRSKALVTLRGYPRPAMYSKAGALVSAGANLSQLMGEDGTAVRTERG